MFIQLKPEELYTLETYLDNEGLIVGSRQRIDLFTKAKELIATSECPTIDVCSRLGENMCVALKDVIRVEEVEVSVTMHNSWVI